MNIVETMNIVSQQYETLTVLYSVLIYPPFCVHKVRTQKGGRSGLANCVPKRMGGRGGVKRKRTYALKTGPSGNTNICSNISIIYLRNIISVTLIN